MHTHVTNEAWAARARGAKDLGPRLACVVITAAVHHVAVEDARLVVVHVGLQHATRSQHGLSVGGWVSGWVSFATPARPGGHTIVSAAGLGKLHKAVQVERSLEDCWHTIREAPLSSMPKGRRQREHGRSNLPHACSTARSVARSRRLPWRCRGRGSSWCAACRRGGASVQR